MVRKLAVRAPIDRADGDAIHALPHAIRAVDPATYLVREGEHPDRCMLLLSGFVFRQKLTSQGARQILSLHIPGDFIDLQNLFLNVSDHNVQALTRATIAEIPRAALRDLVFARPAIGRSMWIDALVDASIFREWIVNVGCRDGRARVAHILCEFAVRLNAVGLGEEYRYELPMTQEQLGDAVGLTPVHVNRMLKGLVAEGLIRRDKRYVSVENWEALIHAGDFSMRYLHLDQTAARDADPVQSRSGAPGGKKAR